MVDYVSAPKQRYPAIPAIHGVDDYHPAHGKPSAKVCRPGTGRATDLRNATLANGIRVLVKANKLLALNAVRSIPRIGSIP
jgi:hypothetical protein